MQAKSKIFILGGFFSHPIDKLCNIKQTFTLQSMARGSFFYFRGLFLAFGGRNRPEPLCFFAPASLLVQVKITIRDERVCTTETSFLMLIYLSLFHMLFIYIQLNSA